MKHVAKGRVTYETCGKGKGYMKHVAKGRVT